MLTEDEIKYYFHDDKECIKRSFKQCDVQSAFVRPSERDEMPEVPLRSSFSSSKLFSSLESQLFPSDAQADICQ